VVLRYWLGAYSVSEYTGDYNELLYLRARHYAPELGRFLTRDAWAGNSSRTSSLNRWVYSENNPVLYTDPTGNSIDSLGYLPMVLSGGSISKNMTAAQLISLCRGFYSPQYWAQKHAFTCSDLNSKEWTKPQSVGALFEDYICESGPERVTFYANDNLTKQLAYSILMDRIRKEFYNGESSYPKEQRFNHLEFLLAVSFSQSCFILVKDKFVCKTLFPPRKPA
jgi:RHS repeat-associated protein